MGSAASPAFETGERKAVPVTLRFLMQEGVYVWAHLVTSLCAHVWFACLLHVCCNAVTTSRHTGKALCSELRRGATWV